MPVHRDSLSGLHADLLYFAAQHQGDVHCPRAAHEPGTETALGKVSLASRLGFQRNAGGARSLGKMALRLPKIHLLHWESFGPIQEFFCNSLGNHRGIAACPIVDDYVYEHSFLDGSLNNFHGL